jgi:hypothetical protein
VSDNVQNLEKRRHNVAWCDLWALSCYCLWSWKNKEMHEANFARPSNQVHHVIKLCQDYRKVMHTNEIVFQQNRVVSYIG